MTLGELRSMKIIPMISVGGSQLEEISLLEILASVSHYICYILDYYVTQ